MKITSYRKLITSFSLKGVGGVLPGDVADTGASPYPTAGAGQAGVGAGPVPLTEGCRPRDPGLAMAVGGTPGERPGPARGAEVCTFT